MKHKILSLAALGLLTVVSCTQEESFQENRITRVSAELPDFMEENGTRSQINVSASDGISYSWAIGDVLGIFPDQGSQLYFTLTESSLSADGKNATFDGGAWALKNGHTYYSYFPFSPKNSEVTSTPTAVSVDYTGQSITEWGDTKNAGHYDFNAAGGVSSTNGTLSFQFIRLGALLRLKFNLPVTANYKKLILSTDADVIPVKGKVDLSASTLVYTPETYASEISVDLNNISGKNGQTVYVYVMLPPMTLLTQKKYLKAVLTYSAGPGVTTYYLCKAGTTTSNTPDFIANTIYKRDAKYYSNYRIIDGHEYVDLGLPSGTLWATCNVGASSPGSYGNSYAWGETKTKTNYSISEYKYCSGAKITTLTKYNNSSNCGSVIDNKMELEPEDDAAYVSWGSHCRTPSKAQFEELINKDYTTIESTSYSGTRGFEIRSKMPGYTSAYIFLPAAGYHIAGGVGYQDVGAYYWTRELTDDPIGAWYLEFSNNYSGIMCEYDRARWIGRSVRPVAFE